MNRLYYMLIINNLRTIEQVPVQFRDEVQALFNGVNN